MDYLPIFLDVRGRRILVEGGGTAAARRAERALQAGAYVEVYDHQLSEEFCPLLDNARLSHFRRRVEQEDIEGSTIVYGASGSDRRDAELFAMAKSAGALVNVADVTEYCDFITPSIIDRSPVVVAISSGGSAPIVARILRARIETLLPAAYGHLAKFMGRFRDVVSSQINSSLDRRRFWERIIDGQVGDFFLAGDSLSAEKQLHKELKRIACGNGEPKIGEVSLVGAGPGDPDLLTFRALRLMQRADVVLFDRLVDADILNLVRRDAKRIDVGKLPKKHTMMQEEISQLMVDQAKQGKRVLRLKGGDPFMFGRGGEEIETLAAHAVPFQVVPGITAASGCSAYAGIPLTHRDHAQSCLFVTAHGRDGVLGLDWEVMLRPAQTVVIYMGLSSLERLAAEFVARGADPDTPAALVDNGTRCNQTVIVGTVQNLYAKTREAGLTGPAIIVIGNVVALRDKFEWFGKTHEEHFQMSLQPQQSL
jgi:uroporphyrin-III C-methyltransferase/precorrin-2 dehydrogenase/sirohydrochlorin ferrochelatase